MSKSGIPIVSDIAEKAAQAAPSVFGEGAILGDRSRVNAAVSPKVADIASTAITTVNETRKIIDSLKPEINAIAPTAKSGDVVDARKLTLPGGRSLGSIAGGNATYNSPTQVSVNNTNLYLMIGAGLVLVLVLIKK